MTNHKELERFKSIKTRGLSAPFIERLKILRTNIPTIEETQSVGSELFMERKRLEKERNTLCELTNCQLRKIGIALQNEEWLEEQEEMVENEILDNFAYQKILPIMEQVNTHFLRGRGNIEFCEENQDEWVTEEMSWSLNVLATQVTIRLKWDSDQNSSFEMIDGSQMQLKVLLGEIIIVAGDKYPHPYGGCPVLRFERVNCMMQSEVNYLDENFQIRRIPSWRNQVDNTIFKILQETSSLRFPKGKPVGNLGWKNPINYKK